ncbi:gamma-glutamylcyclotransferase family protein [Thermoflavimicrobium dichotomicum]|uniref:Cation transport regulator ChaC n=1 Tax=Thermoflavimicrobium dichotomicum TaxID=46223 RepID=A0A1I3PB30_9BACL|nr:gamma-glutamylcyclotransferase family protein [Thermoflavimicrobium dichotomicum]SFJ18631.1 Cation transport regulator ChaC [Thermoflavimicrobium dichotomicum]
MTLYFAYGSCMHEQDFRDTVPFFERLGRAILYDRSLAFTHWSTSPRRKEPTGAADIVFDPGQIVEGILYRIDEKYLSRLRRREGYPLVYQEETITVEFNGKMVEGVLTYSVVDKSEREFAPSEEYATLILEGGRTELDGAYLQRLQEHIKWLQVVGFRP